MSQPAIIVENLSKKFHIGTSGGPGYHRLSEALTGLPRFAMQAARGCFGAVLPSPASSLPPAHPSSPPSASGRAAGGEGQSSASSELDARSYELEAGSVASQDFWALKDVSFEVQPGEVVGIIGRNGAGKSTLLKILSRITEPTSGRFGVRGRVASLLEVGTGFHPELTGRENIYVSGITLGMTRAEIKKRFDEIVDFAGVEKFLDTPVKRYSSGMQVRLGFAVAAHLESEILIVDEVLAVGDAEFQARCLGAMSDVAKSGRTVLFVSHNMAAIRNLCPTAVLLEEGEITLNSESDTVVNAHLSNAISTDDTSDISLQIDALPEDSVVRLLDVSLTQNGERRSKFGNGEAIDTTLSFKVLQKTPGLRLYLDLEDEKGGIVVRTFFDDDADHPLTLEPGNYVSTLRIPKDLLSPRSYFLELRATIFNVRPCFKGNSVRLLLSIERTGSINRAYPSDPVRSLLQPKFNWTTRLADDENS